jgi:hypothetical protein
MRKIFFTLSVALLCCTALMAQKKRWGHFGLLSGMNFSTFRLHGNLTESTDASWKTGFVVGMFDKIPIGKGFSVQPEFLYSSMGGNFDARVGGLDHYRLNYFSIPVLLKYNFLKNWSALFGPQFDLLIQAKKLDNTGGVNKVTSDFKDYNFLFTAGIEGWANKTIVFSGRYMYGFQAVYGSTTTPEFHNHGVQFTIGFQLQ